MPTDSNAQEEFEKQAKDIVESPGTAEAVGPGKTGTFAAKMIQPEDDPRYESGTVLGRNAGWD